jgi:hypothetical protein
MVVPQTTSATDNDTISATQKLWNELLLISGGE